MILFNSINVTKDKLRRTTLYDESYPAQAAFSDVDLSISRRETLTQPNSET